jgi:OmpA-OmpF porin, OOP family
LFITKEYMMQKSFLAAGLFCSFATTAAFAATSENPGTGVYVSGAIGQSQFDLKGPGVSGFNVDNRNTSGGVGVGYNITKNVGVEVGYADFGKAKVSSQLSPNLSGDVRAKATHASAIGTVPLSPEMFVYGRLGVSRTDREAGVAGVDAADKKTEAIYGVGGGYNFTKNLAGTVEWQKLDNTDVQALNAGVRVSF